MSSTTLILDIGSGTQDVLLYRPGQTIENCPKFVLPAPARQVAERIRNLTRAGRHIFLHGGNMGGGFYRAAMDHRKAGLLVTATPAAAYSLADDLTTLAKDGVAIAEECPLGAVAVACTDFDPGFWRALLGACGLGWPDAVMACAQDHGFHPGASNRLGRFNLWQRFLTDAGGRPEALVWRQPPPELTRLACLQAALGGGVVADTGAAAVLGALYDPEVRAVAEERGVTLVNVGNSHTIAFLLHGGRMWGVYEHHTGILTPESLWADLRAFRQGALASQAVFDSRGHGCLTLDLPQAAGGFAPTFVLGPQRGLLAGCDVRFPAPGGDMMLAGCFGLLHGARLAGFLPLETGVNLPNFQKKMERCGGG